MFNWDIYQTLRTACCSGGYGASFSIFHPQPEDFSLDDVTHVTLWHHVFSDHRKQAEQIDTCETPNTMYI